jgi:hypothetical protein
MIDACRAGFWPAAAVSTWPIITSLTSSGPTPVLASNAVITFAPSSVAGILPIVPPNFPTPVRNAATITTSSILKFSYMNIQDSIVAGDCLQRQHDGGRSLRPGFETCRGKTVI